MALNVELQLSADWNMKAAPHDLAIADESALRYNVFLGNLVLQVDGVDFSARWGWIPLLDLAYCLKEMSDEIVGGEAASTFEFTESDSWLRLARLGNAVEISSSYAPQTIITDMRELCEGLTSCAQEFFTKIALQHLELGVNPSFHRMRDRVFAASNPKQINIARPN